MQRLESVQWRFLRVLARLFDKAERLTIQAAKEPHKPNMQAVGVRTMVQRVTAGSNYVQST